uniref:Uncharacterized protein n=1 Tax=Arundo donax TaxID=35708 RepID=A0A0A9GVI6_ARUDO
MGILNPGVHALYLLGYLENMGAVSLYNNNKAFSPKQVGVG